MRSRLLVPAVLAAVLLPLGGQPAGAVSDPASPAPSLDLGPAPSPAPSSTPTPAEALREARGLFEGADTSPGAGREATLILRDLALQLDDLSPDRRREARRLLARPTDGAATPSGEPAYAVPSQSTCTTTVCTHWVPTTADAPPMADADADGVPDWVETSARAGDEVWQKVVGDMGYRRPLPDGGTSDDPGNPGSQLDLYLADLGSDGLYGYCAAEDEGPSGAFTYSGYCVIDDDFAPAQYGGAPALDSLRATVAHEMFHAVQFGYDVAEDLWFMEGSATWVEDEVYDDVDDHRQYLAASQLRYSYVPLDYGDEGFQYGAWVFFRNLSERFTPLVVREAWQQADARTGAPDKASTLAVKAALVARGQSFGDVFARYTVDNLVPAKAYDEGQAYRSPNRLATFTLTPSRLRTGDRATSQFHLSSDAVVFKPGSTLTGARKLRVGVDMAAPIRGSKATLLTTRKDGSLTRKVMGLNSDGRATVTVDFTRSRVAKVELVLTNASTRFTNCWASRSPYTCAGTPVDDRLRAGFSAVAVRG